MDRRNDFPEFVAARRPALRRLAFGLCGDWHAADDIVQAALSRLYRAWPRVRSVTTEDSYARRAVVRAAIDHSRRSSRRELPTDQLPDTAVEPAVEHPFASNLRGALRALPPQQRRVVVLRYWVGLSVADTAAALDVSAGTVKSQSARGLAKLRPLLELDPEGTQP